MWASLCNAISDHTHMEGSLRAFQDEIFYGMRQSLLDLAARVEQESGCRVQVDMNEGYPAVMNPPALYQRVKQAVSLRELDAPMMITEDFSWYQRQLPGMFFFLGVVCVHKLNYFFL